MTILLDGILELQIYIETWYHIKMVVVLVRCAV